MYDSRSKEILTPGDDLVLGHLCKYLGSSLISVKELKMFMKLSFRLTVVKNFSTFKIRVIRTNLSQNRLTTYKTS